MLPLGCEADEELVSGEGEPEPTQETTAGDGRETVPEADECLAGVWEQAGEGLATLVAAGGEVVAVDEAALGVAADD